MKRDIFVIVVIFSFLLLFFSPFVYGITCMGSEKKEAMPVTKENLTKHRVSISPEDTQRQKATTLMDTVLKNDNNGRDSVYIENNGQKLTVTGPTKSWGERGIIFKITHPLSIGNQYVKTVNSKNDVKWYNVNKWKGFYYTENSNGSANDLSATKEHISDKNNKSRFTGYGETVTWPNLRDDKSNDKSSHSFADRQLPEPIKVSDLPGYPNNEKYYHYVVEDWVPKEGEEARLTNNDMKHIWKQAERIDIDPFYFLAVLAAEGTGSFDTKQVEEKQGGQPDKNFAVDVKKAADVIDREIQRWKKAGKPGHWLQWVNLGNADHLNSYKDPQYSSGYNEEGELWGGYAEDITWWKTVMNIYNGFRLNSP